MAIRVRHSTVATTLHSVEQLYPGGFDALQAAHPATVLVGTLVRLPAWIDDTGCGRWSAEPGTCVVESTPHASIRLVPLRRPGTAALIDRGARLRDVHGARARPAAPAPARAGALRPALPPLHPSVPLPTPATAACAPPPARSSAPPALAASPASPPAAAPSVDDLLSKHGLSLGGPPFDVGGDEDADRARRIVLWLRLRKGVPVAALDATHLSQLPANRFDVDATAATWEMRFRAGALASGLGSSAHHPKMAILRGIDAALAARGLTEVYGRHRWPDETAPAATEARR